MKFSACLLARNGVRYGVRVMAFKLHNISSIFISGPVLHRTFRLVPSERQTVTCLEITGMRTRWQCSIHCIQQSDACVGFNFQRGPLVICELCQVPHDASNANMAVDTRWYCYAIVPWGTSIYVTYITKIYISEKIVFIWGYSSYKNARPDYSVFRFRDKGINANIFQKPGSFVDLKINKKLSSYIAGAHSQNFAGLDTLVSHIVLIWACFWMYYFVTKHQTEN